MTRKLRLLSVLFALLLVPIGAWADYELYIQYGTEESNYHSVSVPESATDVLGDGTITYDTESHVLTLNGANLTCSYNSSTFIINNGYWDAELQLTVRLVGSNTITLGNGSSFYDGKGITFTTDESNPGSLQIIKESGWDGILFKDGSTEITPTYEENLAYYSSTSEIKYAESYPLWICGVQVTEANAPNVLNFIEPAVVFDPSTNTLTLNGADINVESNDFIVSGLENLTVFLVGENNLTCYSDNAFSSSVGDATITFTTDADSNGSLTIMAGNLFGDNVTPAYSNVSMKDDGDTHTISSSLGLSVGGVDVTFFNKGDVLGDETAVYDEGTHTLTLNNATIVPDEGEETPGIVYYNEEDLTIALIGDNSVQGAGGCSAISKYYGVETPHLYFVKGDEEQHFSLTLIAESDGDFIDGFNTDYGNFFVFDEEKDDFYTTTISSSVFGGTGSEDEPFLIKTPEDLKNFADGYNEGRFDRNAHIQLFDDIDCEGLEDFTPIADGTSNVFIGVFDGNNKTIRNLTISKDPSGLFGFIGEEEDDDGLFSATIKDLTLENCTISGGDESGAIVGSMSGGTIQNCTVNECEVTTRNAMSPTAGGIAGKMSGGTIDICTVQGSSISATTNYEWGGGSTFAGGIAGDLYYYGEGDITISNCEVSNSTVTASNTNPDGMSAGGIYGGYEGEGEVTITISGNEVKGETQIICIDGCEECDIDYSSAGAIGCPFNEDIFTLSNNTYEYTVTTQRKKGNADFIVGEGYTPRGIGGYHDLNEEEYVDGYDIIGSAMLADTEKLTINMEYAVEGGVDGYYEPLSDYDKGEFWLVSGQEATVFLQTADNYSISSASLSYTATGGAAPTVVNLENGGTDGMYEYSFTMPDYEAMLNVTFTAKPTIWIGSVEVDEDGNFPDIETASFDAETNTLTLNGINYGGEITSGLDELIIKVTGTDNQVNKIVSLNPAATLTFEKASADAAASLSLSTAHLIDATAVISGFASVDFGDMYLSSSTPYKYDATNKLLVDATADETEELTSATVTSVVHYPLWIAGTQATAGTITGEEYHSGDYTFNTVSGVTFTPGTENVLSMENAQIDVRCYDESDHCHPAIISNLDNLTIQLTGGSTINFGGSYGNFIVSSLNSDAVLTFKAVETDASLNTSISSSAYIGTPGNGFSSIVYDNDLFFIAHNTATQSIKKLDAPGIYISDMLLSLYSYDAVADGMESLALKYSIEYFDGETSPVSDATFTDETELTIDAPCIITAYAELNGKRSATATAKYLAFTEPLTLVYSGESYELTNAALPALVPAVAEGDDVTYEIGETSNGSVISFNEATGKWMVDGVGTAVLYMSLNGGDETPYLILNEVAQLTVNVVSDISTMYIADIADIAYTGSAVTPAIVVKASEEAEASLVAGTDYTVSYKQGGTAVDAADLVDLGTYTAVITGTGNYGGTMEVPFKIKRQLDIAFSDNKSWTTYFATESLQVPVGLQAYSVTEITPSEVVAEEVEYIPANTAVLLKMAKEAYAAGPFMAEAYDGTETGIGTNLLQGTSTDLAVSSITTAPVFVLYRDQFVKTTTGSIPAHRGYLVVDPSTFSEPFSRLSIVIGDETTRISVPAIVSSDDSYYDLQGRRVNRADVKKGLYIRNGKKVLIK